MKNIMITNKINDEQKKEVARLYYQAFTKKFNYLWFFTKEEEKAFQVLARSLQYNYGLYALEGNKVLGFIGLNKKNETFFPAIYTSFTKAFGVIGGTWRYVGFGIYRLTKESLDTKTLYIDPVVVSAEARGMGIGTKLFDSTIELSKQLKLNYVTLDVVDTNPKAKKLYEKLGFKVLKEGNTKWITKKAGFEKYFHMKKNILIEND